MEAPLTSLMTTWRLLSRRMEASLTSLITDPRQPQSTWLKLLVKAPGQSTWSKHLVKAPGQSNWSKLCLVPPRCNMLRSPHAL